MIVVLIMAKRFLQIICILVLAGCVATGSPWERSASPPAAAAPSALNRAAIRQIPPSSAMVQQAGLEVYNPDSGNAAPQPGAVERHDLNGGGNSYQPQSPAAVASSPALPPVKVGLLVPLTGPNAQLGQAMLQAAQLALFDMGYDSFELLPRDTNAGAQQAAQSAADAGAQLILGPLFANDVRAAQPIMRRYDINMVSFSTDWSLADGNTFVMGFLLFAQVQRVAEYAASKGLRYVGVLAPDSDYGNAVLATWNAAASRFGITTAETVRFPAGQGDISGIVASFAHYNKDAPKGAPPPYDAVFLPAGGEQARAAASMLGFYNLSPRSVKRLGTGLWDDPDLGAEQGLAGGWFAAPAPELRRGFEQRYAESYGQPAPRLATLAYDATALAAVLARNGYYNAGRPAFDRAALTNPNGFAGIDGIFRFRPDGLVERGLAVMEFRNGQIVEIDPAPKTFERFAGQ